ncbi:MAG: potassium transporter Kup, partial [Cutibacterium granulosum]|nr:potassium transporter Kup [Cutibacterium granulosum]
RVAVTDLGDPADGISYVECHVGFADSQDVPKALALAYDRLPDLNGLDITKAVYFLSVADVKRGDPTDPDSVAATNKMVGWRKMLYVTMNRNQADRTKVFRTPRVRSVVLGEVVEI